MKVLVTGAAGFIGSNVSAHLASFGISVLGVDNLTGNYSVSPKKGNLKRANMRGNFEFIEADILAPKTWSLLRKKGITHIVHLAARAGVRDSTKCPKEYLETNIIGTLNVLEFAKLIRAEKLVVASTSSVYGGNKAPFRESMDTSKPLSVYGASKSGMESLVFAMSCIHNIPVIVLRFFSVYGPGGRPDMAVYKFTRKIINGKEIEIFGDGSAKRDFTYVSDVANAVLLALKSPIKGEAFNIGNSDSRSVNELVSIIEKNVGKRAVKKFTKKRPEDAEQTLADISKAKKMLGYSPKTGLEEGIEKFVGWFNENNGN